MQEKSVTVAGQTHRLELPFFTLATQNPIEQDGTFPLPEAQLDRFFFKLFVGLPNHSEFSEILNRTGGNALPEIRPVASSDEILNMGRFLRDVPIDAAVQDHLIRVVRATHPDNEDAPDAVRKFVRYGASPRGAQSILSASRARALLDGRFHVATEDVNRAALPALRHRVLLSFEGEAEGVSTDDVIRQVVDKISS
jgi:MoxR-like ATPase